jgi:Ca-activated chloride channel family protein
MERERERPEAYDDEVISFVRSLEAAKREYELTDEAISFVRSLETATREYGLSDQDVIARALGEGEWLADLIVAQERNILSMLSELPHLKAVLVYPEEGTVWADHPLALMESWAEPEPNYRVAFERLRQHVLSADTDRAIIRAGFHSARSEDLGSVQEVQRFRQAQPPSIQHLNLVTYGAPPMVLPGIKVAVAIGEQWESVEKPADVCLVIDVSGSMDESDKLPKVKSGVQEFLDRFKSPESMVSVVLFNYRAQREIPLVPLRTNRRDIERAVTRLSAGGQTALFDAVLLAIDELKHRGDSSHIQVIIALTDGLENSSRADLRTVLQELQAHSDLVFYGIAYGGDADRGALEAMARATKGLVVDSSPSGIQQLFQGMSRRV